MVSSSSLVAAFCEAVALAHEPVRAFHQVAAVAAVAVGARAEQCDQFGHGDGSPRWRSSRVVRVEPAHPGRFDASNLCVARPGGAVVLVVAAPVVAGVIGQQFEQHTAWRVWCVDSEQPAIAHQQPRPFSNVRLAIEAVARPADRPASTRSSRGYAELPAVLSR